MMSYQRALIALIAAVLVASCSPSDPENFDWCYEYDFTLDNYGFNIIDGSWDGSESIDAGLRSDETGLLYITYEYPTFVTPFSVVVGVKRPSGVTGDISFSSFGSVYGVDVGLTNQIMPDSLPFAGIEFRAENLDTSGRTISVRVDSFNGVEARPFVVDYLQVRGYGANPFPSSNCLTLPPTGTPPPSATFVPTIAPSNTPTIPATVTGTSTQTPTPGPTSTPLPAWCSTFDWQYEWDFTVSDGGFARYQNFGQTPSGVWVSGTGWTFGGSGGSNTLISVRRTGMSFVAKEIEVTISDNTATRGSVNDSIGAAVASGGTSPPHSSTQLAWGNNADFNETNRIRTATNTANSTSSNTMYIYSSSTPNALNAVSRIRVRGNGASPTMSGGTLTLCNPPTTPTTTPTNTPTATTTSTPVPTNTPTPTTTRTPLPPPATSTATRTPIPISTTTPRPTATATGTATPLPPPTFTPPPTNTPGGPTNTPAPTLDVTPTFATGTPNATPTIVGGTPTQIATGTPTPGLPPGVGDQYSDGVGELQNAVGNAVANAEGLASTMGSWLGTGVGLMTGIIDDFINAPPEAVPNLPTCASNPTAHDLCAIYYILKFTLFAPGTPGALILPLALIAYNIFAIFIFVRYLLVLIRRGMEAIQG